MKKTITHILITVLILFLIYFVVFLEAKYAKDKNDQFVTTQDGVKIAFNEIQTGHKEVLIIAPGWFMCKSSSPFAEMASDFSKDFNVIVMDFRGHCKSHGKYTFTNSEYYDLKSVIDYAKNKYQKIYVAGFSLGAATAVIEQSKYHNIDKLILVSPPEDFDKIENAVWKKEAFIPTLQKFEFKRWISVIPGETWLDKVKPVDVISGINIPVLMIAGIKDPTIRAVHTEKLFRKAREPKKLVVYGDSIHAEDIYLEKKERFIKSCTDWLKE